MDEARKEIIDYWQEEGKNLISVIEGSVKVEMAFSDFLRYYCVAQGGNWGGMLLTGIKELWPFVWDAIPNKIGNKGFFCLCDVIRLLGVNIDE